jgi:hypothetical protein
MALNKKGPVFSMQNNMSYDVGYRTGTGYAESKSIFGRLKDSLLDILTNEEPEQPISLFQLRERNDNPVNISERLPQAQAQIAYAPTSQVVYTVEDSAIPYQPITIPPQAQAQLQQGMQRPNTTADYTMISTQRQQPGTLNQTAPANQTAQVNANPMADRFHRYLGQEEPVRTSKEAVVPNAFQQQASPSNTKPAQAQSIQANQTSGNPFNPFFQVQPGQRSESLFFGQTPPHR